MRGLDRFQRHFAGAERQYVLIGGTACEVVLSEAGLSARSTKDLDIVLCVEALDDAFIHRLWRFIDEGGYRARERATGPREFYRFHRPADESFPAMLEFFSRRPGGLFLPDNAVLTPMPVAEEIMSLSAILLDDAYYGLLLGLRRIVDGLSVLDEKGLIPFKARAYIDLRARRDADGSATGDDVKKHRADVFRLAQLLPEDASIDLPEQVAADLERFLALAADDEAFRPPSGPQPSETIARLRRAYRLSR